MLLINVLHISIVDLLYNMLHNILKISVININAVLSMY